MALIWSSTKTQFFKTRHVTFVEKWECSCIKLW